MWVPHPAAPYSEILVFTLAHSKDPKEKESSCKLSLILRETTRANAGRAVWGGDQSAKTAPCKGVIRHIAHGGATHGPFCNRDRRTFSHLRKLRPAGYFFVGAALTNFFFGPPPLAPTPPSIMQAPEVWYKLGKAQLENGSARRSNCQGIHLQRPPLRDLFRIFSLSLSLLASRSPWILLFL